MPARRLLVGCLAAVTLVGCATHAHDRGVGAFRFEGDPALGEIRVVPILEAYEPPELRTDGYVTDGIIDARVVLREQRMDELARVPDQVATALPGAIHARLDQAWTGHFKVGHLPMGARARLEGALRRGDPDDLEVALADAARGVGGQATLFTWVTDLTADPLTSEGFPGDRVDTAAGPVVLDIFEEPYRVKAEVGVALVRADGFIVLRYDDTSASLLSPSRNASRVGRDLAGNLAGEVAKMWPDDPRLWRSDPDRCEPVPEAVPDPVPRSSLVGAKDPAPSDDLPEVPFQGLRKANDGE